MEPKFFGTDDCTYYRDSMGQGWLIQHPGSNSIKTAEIPADAVELGDAVLDQSHYDSAEAIEEIR